MKNLFKSLIRNHNFQVAVVILLTEVLFFYPIFFKGEVIVSDVYLKFFPYKQYITQDYSYDSDLRSDMIDSYYPKRKLFFDSIKSGDFPYWENNVKFGVPVINILDSYFPLEYLALFIPLSYVLTLSILLKVFVSGFCTYHLLKTLRLKHTSSLFGAIVYIYSGFNIVWFWNNAATTSYMLPVLLLAVLKILKGDYKYALLLIYSTSLLLLTGFISGAGYGLYLCGLFTFVYFVRSIVQNKSKINSLSSFAGLLKPYAAVGLSVLIGLSLVLFVLLPTLDYLNYIDVYSYRTASNSNYYLDFITNFPQLIVPYYNGGPILGSFVGGANYNETSGYIPILGFIFVIVGVVNALRKRVGWACFFIFIYLFSISVVYKIGPTLDLINGFPIFDSSSNTRLLMWAAFSASVLSALGFEYLQTTLKWMNLKIKSFKYTALLSVIGVILVSLYSLYRMQDLGIRANIQNIQPEFYKSAIVLCVVIGIFCFFVGLYIWKLKKWNIRYLQILIISLMFIESWVYGLKQVASLPAGLYYPQTSGIEFLQNNTKDLERIMAFDGTFALRGTETYYDLATPFDHNLYSDTERELLKQLYIDESISWMSKTSPRNEGNNVYFESPLMDKLNIKYLVFAPDQEFNAERQKALDENFVLVFDEVNELKIYENKSGYSLTHSTGNTNTSILMLENDEEKFVVEADSDTIFYVSEAYYPDWKATVDGKEVDVFAYQDLWKAVNLAKGEHTIEFYYEEPNSFKYGLIYTIVANIIIVSGAILILVKHSRGFSLNMNNFTKWSKNKETKVGDKK